MKRLVIFATLFLAACAPHTSWENARLSPAQDGNNRRECAYEAEKATAGLDDAWRRGSERRKLLASCLELRGYAKVAAR